MISLFFTFIFLYFRLLLVVLIGCCLHFPPSWCRHVLMYSFLMSPSATFLNLFICCFLHILWFPSHIQPHFPRVIWRFSRTDRRTAGRRNKRPQARYCGNMRRHHCDQCQKKKKKSESSISWLVVNQNNYNLSHLAAVMILSTH